MEGRKAAPIYYLTVPWGRGLARCDRILCSRCHQAKVAVSLGL